MERKEFALQSEYDNLTLHGTVYEPKGKKKGIFQIEHGMCERTKRYEEMMKFFCSYGYVTVCHDHRGHGDSVEKEEDRGWFRDKQGKAIVSDSVQITRYIKQLYPDLPVVLFGHSMGSMVVRCYIQEHDDLIDKLIVCGSPSKNPLAGMGIFVAKTLSLFKGDRHRSRLLAYLSTGKGNQKFPNEGKGCWLSRNRQNIEEFYADEKCRFVFTCNGFENLFKLMKNTYSKKEYEVKNPSLPIFFVSGSDDAVLGGEKGFKKTVEFMRKRGYTNVSSKLYPKLRHEIFNDLGKEEVYADLLAFTQK